MFTQFFGNYLLNEHYVTTDQLCEALQKKQNTRLKLGILAINAGYLTAANVEKIHIQQTREDKRFGDIAISLGYLTKEQVDELLTQQKQGYLLLGQTLVDLGYLTNAKFETSIHEYKTKFSLTDVDITEAKAAKIDHMVDSLFHFSQAANGTMYLNYIRLLMNNLVRFIGDDFTPLQPAYAIEPSDTCYQVSQKINGEFSALTTLLIEESDLLPFAAKYADEEISEVDAYAKDAACDFMNIHNGLFTVNVSNEAEIELTLDPPEVIKGIQTHSDQKICVIPICYPFGVIRFTITL